MTNNGDPPDDQLDISTPRDAREKRCGMTDDRLKVPRGGGGGLDSKKDDRYAGTGSPGQQAGPAGLCALRLEWSWALVFPERGRASSSFRCVSIVSQLLSSVSLAVDWTEGQCGQEKCSLAPGGPSEIRARIICVFSLSLSFFFLFLPLLVNAHV